MPLPQSLSVSSPVPSSGFLPQIDPRPSANALRHWMNPSPHAFPPHTRCTPPFGLYGFRGISLQTYDCTAAGRSVVLEDQGINWNKRNKEKY